MPQFFKKPLVIILVIIVVIVGAVIVLLSRAAPIVPELAKVQRGEIIDEVSVTGRVKSAEDVDLAFEQTGKVSQVYVDVGDRVYRGALLVGLSNGELEAKLLESEAQLAFEEARLSELQAGTRQEEIQKAEVDLANAIRKADADLKDVYDAALTAAQNAVSDGKIAILDLSDIQDTHFSDTSANSIRLSTAKGIAVEALLGVDGAGRWRSEFLSVLDGGAFGLVQDAVVTGLYKDIDAALVVAADALQKVKQALEKVPIIDDLTSTEKTTLSSAKSSVSTEITSVANSQQNIAVQKVSNENAIATAKVALDLKKAGTVSEQITAQEAKVKLAKASMQNIQAQLSKTVLSAPFSGVVTKQDAQIGEIVGANEALVSLLSEAAFEIEVNIPEADIARITVGDKANVTLDAYGRYEEFEAVVQEVDLAGTLIQGVATYKTTLQFVKADERIKSGMTANVDIVSSHLTDVLFVPQRAVIAKNGGYIVRIVEGEEIKEIDVEIGLRGSEGTTQILSGLKEGDEVVVFIKE